MGRKYPEPTCPVQINKRLALQIIMEALSAVLLQLDLLDPHSPGYHFILVFPQKQTVGQLPIYSNRKPLLGDLIASLHLVRGSSKQQSTLTPHLSQLYCKRWPVLFRY